jgi:flagellar protein FliO/FliZ
VSSRFGTAVIFGVVAQAAVLVAFAGDVTRTVGLPTAAVAAGTVALSEAAAGAADVRAADTTAPAASAPPRPFAAPQSVTSPTAPTAGGLAQVTFALLIVLVAIFAVAWVARRMRGFNNRVGGAIDVLADVPLGQKERAVLLKVGSKQILLGVAPGRVNTLHVLEEPLELSKPPAGPNNDSRPNFKQLMLRSLGK